MRFFRKKKDQPEPLTESEINDYVVAHARPPFKLVQLTPDQVVSNPPPLTGSRQIQWKADWSQPVPAPTDDVFAQRWVRACELKVGDVIELPIAGFAVGGVRSYPPDTTTTVVDIVERWREQDLYLIVEIAPAVTDDGGLGPLSFIELHGYQNLPLDSRAGELDEAERELKAAVDRATLLAERERIRATGRFFA